MTMTEKFKILAKYIKDMSSETPDVETYMSAGNNMGKYQLDIDIKSIALKNKMIEVNITCLLYTSPSPRDLVLSRMPSSA